MRGGVSHGKPEIPAGCVAGLFFSDAPSAEGAAHPRLGHRPGILINAAPQG
jgi:hypothetical protein